VKQSARPARPRARWQGAALAPLLAIAALALGLLVAPAASAAPAAAATPNLGSVRHLDVDLDIRGAAPLGLDLSGAGVRFTSASGTTGTCLTHALGHCDVRWASNGKVSGSGTPELRLPTGTYTVTQVADLPVPGLQPKPGTLATVSIGDHWHTVLGWRISERSERLAVPNTSLYRHTVTARVVDEAGDPVRDARYRLTGPGFPTLLGGFEVLDAGVERSNRNGELTFTTLVRAQVLRPGTWTLTPVAVPEPYLAEPLQVELTAAAPGGNTWAVGPVVLTEPPAPLPPETGSATLTLQPGGPAPADLDLSGIEFELVGSGEGAATGTCVTDVAGSCSVEVVPDSGTSTRPAEGSEIALPVGTYAVTQTSAPEGLTIAAEIAPLELCVSRTPEACATSRTISNTSTYRTRTEVRVLSADGPVPAVEVTLTGPGFAAAPLTTDEDGRAAWSGWFRPGEWWFAVAGQEAPLLVTMAPGQGDTSLPWLVEITLPSPEVPEVPEEPGTTPTTPVTPPTTTPGAPSEVPTAVDPATPGSTAPSTGTAPLPGTGTVDAAAGGTGAQPGGAPRPADAGTNPGTGTGTAAARVVEPVTGQPEEQAAAPSTPAAPGTASSPAPSAGGSGGQVFVPAGDEPALATESSSRLLTAGLVTGVGILFVALVLTGYAVLRSRTRRRA
jgi:hypothetical protein